MNKDPLIAILFASVLLVGLIVAVPTALAETTDPDPGVSRDLPERGFCGRVTTVTLTVEPPAGTESWLLVEHVPEGLRVSDVDPSNNGAYNETRHRIEWVSVNGLPATHTYNVTVPEDFPDSANLDFHGEYRFHPMMEDRYDVLGRIGLTIDCIDEPPEAEGGAVTRALPGSVRCGETLSVALTVDAGIGHGAWIINEGPPVDTTIDGFTTLHNADYSETTHRLKWISLRGTDADLVYNVSVPSDASTGTLPFSGTYMFAPGMNESAVIQGEDTVRVVCGSVGLVLLSLAVIPLAAMGGIFYVRRRGGLGGNREGPEGP